jgi:chromosome segregation ATPase
MKYEVESCMASMQSDLAASVAALLNTMHPRDHTTERAEAGTDKFEDTLLKLKEATAERDELKQKLSRLERQEDERLSPSSAVTLNKKLPATKADAIKEIKQLREIVSAREHEIADLTSRLALSDKERDRPDDASPQPSRAIGNELSPNELHDSIVAELTEKLRIADNRYDDVQAAINNGIKIVKELEQKVLEEEATAASLRNELLEGKAQVELLLKREHQMEQEVSSAVQAQISAAAVQDELQGKLENSQSELRAKIAVLETVSRQYEELQRSYELHSSDLSQQDNAELTTALGSLSWLKEENQKLSHVLAEKDEYINSYVARATEELAAVNSAWQDKFSDQLSAFGDLEHQLAAVTEDLTVSRAESGSLNERISLLEAESEELRTGCRAAVSVAEGEQASTKLELSRRIDEYSQLQAEFVALNNLLLAKDKVLNDLKLELDNGQQQKETVDTNSKLQARISELETDLAAELSFRASVESKIINYDSLQVEFGAKEKLVADLSEDLNLLQAENEDLRSKLIILEQTSTDLASKYTSEVANVEKLKTEVNTLTDELENARGKADGAVAAAFSLQSELDALIITCADLERSFTDSKDAKDQIVLLQEQLRERQHSIEQLHAAAANSGESSKNQALQFEALESELRQALDEKDNELKFVRQQLDEELRTSGNLENSLQSSLVENVEKSDRLNMLSLQHEELLANYQNIHAELSSCRLELENTTRERVSLAQNLEALMEEFELVKSDIVQKSGELCAKDQQMQELSQKIADTSRLEAELKQRMDSELDMVRRAAAAEEALSKLDEKKKRDLETLKKLNEKITSLQRELSISETKHVEAARELKEEVARLQDQLANASSALTEVNELLSKKVEEVEHQKKTSLEAAEMVAELERQLTEVRCKALSSMPSTPVNKDSLPSGEVTAEISEIEGLRGEVQHLKKLITESESYRLQWEERAKAAEAAKTVHDNIDRTGVDALRAKLVQSLARIAELEEERKRLEQEAQEASIKSMDFNQTTPLSKQRQTVRLLLRLTSELHIHFATSCRSLTET